MTIVKQNTISWNVPTEFTYTTRDGYPPYEFDTGVYLISRTNYRSGESNPNWRQQIANGLDMTTVMEGVLYKCRFSPSTAFATWPLPAWVYNVDTMTFVGYPFLPTYDYTPSFGALEADMINQAKARLINKASALIRPLMGGAFIAELHKTLQMIRNPLRVLQKEVVLFDRDVKKRYAKLALRSRKRFVREAFLEATYGWQPLVYDIQGGLLALKKFSEHHLVTKVRASSKADLDPVLSTTPSAFGALAFETDMLEEAQLSVYLNAGLRLQSPDLMFDAESFGFSLRDVVATAWELSPYSFLVDYVTNVAEIIDGASIVNRRLAYCSMAIRRVTSRVMVRQTVIPNGGSVQFTPGEYKLSKKSVNRTAVHDIVPDFQVSLPGFGSMQTLNTAFLALSKVGY